MAREQTLKKWLVVFVVNIVVAVFLILELKNLPPEIPLFYGRPTGEEQLALRQMIFLPIVITSILGVVNFSLSQVVLSKFIKDVFWGIFVILTALSTITILKIIFLVGNIL